MNDCHVEARGLWCNYKLSDHEELPQETKPHLHYLPQCFEFQNKILFSCQYRDQTTTLHTTILLNIHSPDILQFPPFITGRHGCKETFCSNYLQLSFSSIRQEPSQPCKLKEIISRVHYECPAINTTQRAFAIWIIFIKVNGGTGQHSYNWFPVQETDLTSGHFQCPCYVKCWETFPQVSLYHLQYSTSLTQH